MKRLLLGSLLSCMLVGQSLCDPLRDPHCITMGKGFLDTSINATGAAILGGCLGLVWTGEEKCCSKAASCFATIRAIMDAFCGIMDIGVAARELNCPARAWYGLGQFLGACAVVAYLSKGESN